MEYGSIEREIHVDAAPEIVFEVISSPEHMREWWGGVETDVTPTVGSRSEVVWWRGTPDAHIQTVTVVEVDPPRRFAFRWVADEGGDDAPALLVTFELVPTATGTLLRLTETGFREKGWEIATLEAAYADHVNGWDRFVPAIAEYAGRLAATR